jgi:lipopolysaccharide export system permease protein
MKKILFNKILLDCFSFFLIVLLSASTIIWVFQAVNFLDIMIEDGRDYLIYINYSLLNFPKIISKILPFSLFFSFLYIISKYELNNELMIFWNFGIHKIRLINFFMRISLIFLLIQILFTSLIVPKTQDIARSFLRTSDVNFFGSLIKTKKFNDTVKGLTVYSEKKDEDGNLINIYLKKESDENNFQITYAKKGVFKKISNSQILELVNGETISISNEKVTKFNFSKSDLNLNNLETNTTTYIKTKEISTYNLLKCYDILFNLELIRNYGSLKIENCSFANLGNINKELYKRLIIPFYVPLLILVSLLLTITSKENTNYLNFRIFIFIIGMIIIIGSETTLSLINDNFIKNLKISLIPIILLIILYLLFFFKFRTNIKKL